jgi:hypothetical protein
LIQFDLKMSRPSDFALHFRIPAWTEGASISVNGKRRHEELLAGSFATLQREWRTGDRVELDLPLTKHLEPIDKRHPNTAALLSGPLVLFAITDAQPTISSKQLLAAKKLGAQKWHAETSAAPLTMLPFTAISDEQYSTYLVVT